MRRREFITLLGSAAAFWPLAAHGQQPAMPVIGFLSGTTSAPFAHLVAAYREGLREMGYVEGRNRRSNSVGRKVEYNRLPEMAADLVRRHVTVITTMRRRPSRIRGQGFDQHDSDRFHAPAATRSSQVSSRASTARVAMSPGSHILAADAWRASDWGSCGSWFRQSPDRGTPATDISVYRNPRRWRKQLGTLGLQSEKFHASNELTLILPSRHCRNCELERCRFALTAF